MNEQWVPVRGFEGHYEVSNAGRVRSLTKLVRMRWGAMRKVTGCILKQRLDKDGYVIYALSRASKQTNVKAHRLVAEHFIPNPSNLPEVNHDDLDKTNNGVANLSWSTHKENLEHAKSMGRFASHHMGPRKLTTDQVNEMRVLFVSGIKLPALVERFKVSKATASRVTRSITHETVVQSDFSGARRGRYILKSVRQAVWQRDAASCQRCGSSVVLEFDHILAQSAGGISTAENIQVLCGMCNRHKGRF